MKLNILHLLCSIWILSFFGESHAQTHDCSNSCTEECQSIFEKWQDVIEENREYCGSQNSCSITELELLKFIDFTAPVRRCNSTLYHENGNVAKSGTTWYHANGNLAKSGTTWYHSNGNLAKSGTTWYHGNGNLAKSGTTWYHGNGNLAKSGTTWYHANGNLAKSGNQLYYPNDSSAGRSNGLSDFELGKFTSGSNCLPGSYHIFCAIGKL